MNRLQSHFLRVQALLEIKLDDAYHQLLQNLRQQHSLIIYRPRHSKRTPSPSLQPKSLKEVSIRLVYIEEHHSPAQMLHVHISAQ